MSERFYGENRFVGFSNGATEDLFRILVEVLVKNSTTKSSGQTIDFLKRRLDLAEGARAFALDHTCQIDNEVLLGLSLAFSIFADNLTKRSPSFESSEIVWDRELRLSWLARIAEIHSLIENRLKDRGQFTKPLHINLSKEDELTFKRQKLLNLFWNRGNRSKVSQENIAIYREIVDLSEQDVKTLSDNDLASIYLQYTTLLDETEHKDELNKTWMKFLSIAEKQGDEEGINLAKQQLEIGESS